MNNTDKNEYNLRSHTKNKTKKNVMKESGTAITTIKNFKKKESNRLTRKKESGGVRIQDGVNSVKSKQSNGYAKTRGDEITMTK